MKSILEEKFPIKQVYKSPIDEFNTKYLIFNKDQGRSNVITVKLIIFYYSRVKR